MAAVPSPVRSQVWRTSAISSQILLPKIVNRQNDWIHGDCLRGLPKQEGIVTRISDKCRKGEIWLARTENSTNGSRK